MNFVFTTQIVASRLGFCKKIALTVLCCLAMLVLTFTAAGQTITSFSPAAGPIGTLVTVQGTALTSVTSATIGGKSAIIISNNGSQLVAMVMPGAATGVISVTGGSTVSSASSFTISAPVYPSVQAGAKLVGTPYSGTNPFFPQEGSSVAISADHNTIAFGAEYDDHSGSVTPGAVYVFIRSGNSWVQQAKLSPPGGVSAGLGESVALSADGNTLIAGAPGYGNTGAALVFTRTGGIWTQQGSLTGTGQNGNPTIGISVAISADGNTAVAGGPNDNRGEAGSGTGGFWIFSRTGGVWSPQGGEMIGTGATGAAAQGIWVALSADGNTIAESGIDDNYDRKTTLADGAVWIFSRQANLWTQVGSKLTSANSDSVKFLGWGLGLSADGTTLAAGGTDGFWVFTRSQTGWIQQGAPLSVSKQVGNPTISADGNIIAAESDQNGLIGGAQLFTRNNGTWSAQGSLLTRAGLIPLNGGTEFQGGPLAISADGGFLIFGCPIENTFTGAVWVFEPEQDASLLSGLQVSQGELSPVFNRYTTSYADTIANAADSIKITPIVLESGSTITVNGAVVASGTTSSSIVTPVGSSIVNVIVTAPDGVTTQTYSINVYRPSGNDNLDNLVFSDCTLSPAFSASNLSYTAYLHAASTTATVTPTADDANATIKVNGVVVPSGTASAALAVADNPITITITAADRVTTKTYTVNLTNASSSNDNLSDLTISQGQITPDFTPAKTTYNVTVNNFITALSITPTAADPTATMVVNGVPAGSAITLPPDSLVVGTNVISITLTAQNGASKTYTMNITRVPASNDNLTWLSINNGAFSPAYNVDVTSYTVDVPLGQTSATTTPTAAFSNANITVNGATVASGAASAPIALGTDPTPVNVVVTAPNGITTKTYTMNVVHAASHIASLSALTVSQGALSPAFSSNILNYTVYVPLSVEYIAFTPTVTVPGSVVVENTPVASGTSSPYFYIPYYPGRMYISVMAQDKTLEQYSVWVVRTANTDEQLQGLTVSAGSLTPAFSPVDTNYSVTVNNSITSISITPFAANNGQSITVNGAAVTSGTPSALISLNVGLNTIPVVVAALNGVGKQTYLVNVTRVAASNDKLTSIKLSAGLLSPAFEASYLTYTASEPNSVSAFTITPTSADSNATIKINGTTVTSGIADSIALAVGSNSINILVTAANGITNQTYTITVTRAAGGADAFAPIGVTQPTETPQLADDGVEVHKSVSPNDDGIEDFLQIDNITQYPDNRLVIMNRNGLLVYEAKGYDNSTKVFDGHSNKTGQMQLPGTYFFALDYTVNGIIKHKTGFLVLKY